MPSRQGHCMEPGCVTKCNAIDCLDSQLTVRALQERYMFVVIYITRWMEGWMERRTDGRPDGRTDGRTEGKMDGWMDE